MLCKLDHQLILWRLYMCNLFHNTKELKRDTFGCDIYLSLQTYSALVYICWKIKGRDTYTILLHLIKLWNQTEMKYPFWGDRLNSLCKLDHWGCTIVEERKGEKERKRERDFLESEWSQWGQEEGGIISSCRLSLVRSQIGAAEKKDTKEIPNDNYCNRAIWNALIYINIYILNQKLQILHKL